MLDAGLITPDQVVCPTTGKAYTLVFDRSPSRDGLHEHVVAYEPWTDQHGEGGNVIFAGGHGEFLRTQRYNAVVVAKRR